MPDRGPAPHALPVHGVLFDLDGTLADTAGDLAGALNRLRAEQGLAAVPVDALRAHASAQLPTEAVRPEVVEPPDVAAAP